MISEELQIRFQLNIRFGFGILALDPELTNFSGLKKTQSDFVFLSVCSELEMSNHRYSIGSIGGD